MKNMMTISCDNITGYIFLLSDQHGHACIHNVHIFNKLDERNSTCSNWVNKVLPGRFI